VRETGERSAQRSVDRLRHNAVAKQASSRFVARPEYQPSLNMPEMRHERNSAIDVMRHLRRRGTGANPMEHRQKA